MPGGGLRPRAFARLLAVGLLASCVLAGGMPARAAGAAAALGLEVAAPGTDHLAWASAERLRERLRAHGIDLAPQLAAGAASADKLALLPLRELARRVPALAVLELPYFYPDLAAVHRAWDGALGQALREAARAQGVEVLALWDEGLQILSGNLAYTHPRTLSGAEFVLLRDDPIAERELRALDAWSRSARPTSLPQLHKECVVSSRAATAQQIARERLARVHLDLTLTRHRYEGWVVALPRTAWNALAATQRQAFTAALAAVRTEQRRLAAKAEADALAQLRRDGMTPHPLAPATWRGYRGMQPDWDTFLDAALDAPSRRRLLGLAAAAAGLGGDTGRPEAAAQPRPRTP